MTRGRSDVPERGEAGPDAAVGLPTMQAMLDQLIQGCAIFDAAHRLGAWNGQLQQLLKLSDAELAGAPTFERFIRRQAEHGYSFVDCLSFCLMRERTVRDALTTDGHFREAGFSALLVD